MVAMAVITLFFVGLAIAGLRGWVADSRHVAYGLAWPVAPAPVLDHSPPVRSPR
jgi:hypothetical protein